MNRLCPHEGPTCLWQPTLSPSIASGGRKTPEPMGRNKSGGTIKQRALQSRGQPSQFESASVARKRHNVIGDRIYGTKARSTLQARARSDQIRRETLLIEHQQKNRTNAFVDGRFGEEDEGMPEEDKLIHRFQRERQRQLKASKRSGYSLEDDTNGGGGGDSGNLGKPITLTHGGVALDMENLSDGDFGDSEDEMPKSMRRKDDRGFEGADFIKGAHFGNVDEDDNERKLTQKELLEQTIAKYKMQKFERQEVRRLRRAVSLSQPRRFRLHLLDALPCRLLRSRLTPSLFLSSPPPCPCGNHL